MYHAHAFRFNSLRDINFCMYSVVFQRRFGSPIMSRGDGPRIKLIRVHSTMHLMHPNSRSCNYYIYSRYSIL